MEATSTNVSALLVVALAFAAVIFILRKRYDSNLPLLFYFVALVFTNTVELRNQSVSCCTSAWFSRCCCGSNS